MYFYTHRNLDELYQVTNLAMPCSTIQIARLQREMYANHQLIYQIN